MRGEVRISSLVEREDSKISSFFGRRGAARSEATPLAGARAKHPNSLLKSALKTCHGRC
ncbi:hypothetical protein E2C01_068337 [Portunus trituberculatus]|uniref:Uncharacterized protein n=1 Tax=Portunus trituberculatus TaxID=210409 RepID=A0A5B7HVI6_PORTR|nr:hypothetical protein [Portunus trituberculatus]